MQTQKAKDHGGRVGGVPTCSRCCTRAFLQGNLQLAACNERPAGDGRALPMSDQIEDWLEWMTPWGQTAEEQVFLPGGWS